MDQASAAKFYAAHATTDSGVVRDCRQTRASRGSPLPLVQTRIACSNPCLPMLYAIGSRPPRAAKAAWGEQVGQASWPVAKRTSREARPTSHSCQNRSTGFEGHDREKGIRSVSTRCFECSQTVPKTQLLGISRGGVQRADQGCGGTVRNGPAGVKSGCDRMS